MSNRGKVQITDLQCGDGNVEISVDGKVVTNYVSRYDVTRELGSLPVVTLTMRPPTSLRMDAEIHCKWKLDDIPEQALKDLAGALADELTLRRRKQLEAQEGTAA